MQKKEVIEILSQMFGRSEKTIVEFLLSLKNLGLLEENRGEISLTAIAVKMVTNRESFWRIMKDELLKDKIIFDIIHAIQDITEENFEIKSSENYFKRLSALLHEKYDFAYASPRDLDRFISLFRKLKILDYDPFTNGYFVVRTNKIEDEILEKMIWEKYGEIRSKFLRKTGTNWVPINQVRSKIANEYGIASEVIDDFLRSMIGKQNFQFAEASAARREVRKGGIKKNSKLYYYMKVDR